MTPKERSSIDNGIWLCRNCAVLIDRDAEKYRASILRSWKQGAEARALLGINRPARASGASVPAKLGTPRSVHEVLSQAGSSMSEIARALGQLDPRLKIRLRNDGSMATIQLDVAGEEALPIRLNPKATPDRITRPDDEKLEHWLFIANLDNWHTERGVLKEARWKIPSAPLAYAMLVNPCDGKAHIEFFFSEEKLDLLRFLHRAWSGRKEHTAMLTGLPDTLVHVTHPRDWYLVWDDEEELGDATNVTELLANRGLVERRLGEPNSPVAKALMDTLLRLFACEQANLDEVNDPFDFDDEPEDGYERDGSDDDDEPQSILLFDNPWDEALLAKLGAIVSRLFSDSYLGGSYIRNNKTPPHSDRVGRPLSDSWLHLFVSRRQHPMVDWFDTEFKPFFRLA